MYLPLIGTLNVTRMFCFAQAHGQRRDLFVFRLFPHTLALLATVDDLGLTEYIYFKIVWQSSTVGHTELCQIISYCRFLNKGPAVIPGLPDGMFSNQKRKFG
jgi:hypothetical protein